MVIACTVSLICEFASPHFAPLPLGALALDSNCIVPSEGGGPIPNFGGNYHCPAARFALTVTQIK
jgi:hypothetical protein